MTEQSHDKLTAFIDAVNRRENDNFRERCQQQFGEQWKREWVERKAKAASAIALCVLAITAVCLAQLEVPNPIPNDTVTGTTQNKLVKYNTTSSATSVIITATTDKTGAVGVCSDGCGTSGKAAVISFGAASVVTDNATTPNDYLTISSTVAGDAHDFGSTCPTDGSQVIGRIFGAGGAAGTYTVDLKPGLCPAAPAAITLCNVLGSSDTITTATSFATTCSVSGLVQGSLLEIRAHGVLSTTGTASPVENLQVNAGGTTGICQHSTNSSLSTNLTNVSWDLVCSIHILTTGAPGTATTWGVDNAGTGNTNGVYVTHEFPQNAATQSYTTNTPQTVSIQQTATLVSGTSLTLQELVVRNLTAQ